MAQIKMHQNVQFEEYFLCNITQEHWRLQNSAKAKVSFNLFPCTYCQVIG